MTNITSGAVQKAVVEALGIKKDHVLSGILWVDSTSIGIATGTRFTGLPLGSHVPVFRRESRCH